MKRELGKGLNDAWVEFGPWPWPFGCDGLRSRAHQPAHFPSPRLKRLSLLGPARGQRGAAWPTRTLTGAARIGCAVTVFAAHAVARPAAARRWTESDKVFG
jgi:hypothetical protein